MNNYSICNDLQFNLGKASYVCYILCCMSYGPLKQFEVFSLLKMPDFLGYNIDFTNASLYMTLSVILAIVFMMGVLRAKVIPGYWQACVELVYDFVIGSIDDNAGKIGRGYAPIIMTTFLFILFCNIVGLLPLPMSFTVTSHIVVTFAISLTIFIIYTIASFKVQKLSFFKLFLPPGTPLWLAPMMILVEAFAYLSRPFSLSIRLAANMIAGHTILKVIAGFVVSIGGVASIVPFVFVMMLIAFEMFIAVLQAYIFTILICVYLNDVLHSH